MRAAFCFAGLVAAALFLSQAADAASFDCMTVGGPEAQAICSLPALSDMDGKVAAAYDAALRRLGPDGQRALKASQDQWLAAMRAACAPLRDDPAMLPVCMSEPYRQRLSDLADPVREMGGFTFLRIGTYGFVPCKNDFSCTGPFSPGFVHTAYPMIDTPSNSAAQSFNKLVIERLPPLASALQPDIDVTMDFRVIGVSPGLVSVRFDLTENAHRAGQGGAFAYGLNALLPAGRQLGAQDIFRDGVAWQAPLAQAALQSVQEQLGAQASLTVPEQIPAIAQDPNRWAITPQGLEVLLGANDLGPDIQAPAAAHIPWAVLKPYLRDPLPFQLPQ